MRAQVAAAIGGMILGVVAPAVAQSAQPETPAAVKAAGQGDQRPSRYQIGVMERVLEGAVEHGAAVIRDRLQAIVPAGTTGMLVSDNARVRGFRLDNYGVFFDVEVPSLQGTLAWSLRTLDQNDLGLQSALTQLRSHVQESGDPALEQALRRVELQVGPLGGPAGPTVRTASTATNGARQASGSAAVAPADTAPEDPILVDPDGAYRTEVRQALMDAMLDYSGPLTVGDEEWLTIAARRNDDRPRLAPADSEAHTMVIRIRGADLAAFRGGRLSREQAFKRMEVRLF